MPAAQFHAAIAAARTYPALEEISRTLWRAHAEGILPDAAAQAAAEALQARKRALRDPTLPPAHKNAPAPATVPLESRRQTGPRQSPADDASPCLEACRPRSPPRSPWARSRCCRSSQPR